MANWVGLACLAVLASSCGLRTSAQFNTQLAPHSNLSLSGGPHQHLALGVGDFDRAVKDHPFPLSCASGERGVACWRASYCEPPDSAGVEGFPFCSSADAPFGIAVEAVSVPAVTEVTALSSRCAVGSEAGARQVVCWQASGAADVVPSQLYLGDDTRVFSGDFGNCVLTGGSAQCWRAGETAFVTLPALRNIRDLAITREFLFFVSDEGVSYAKYEEGAAVPSGRGPIAADFKPVHVSALSDSRYPGAFFNGCVVGAGAGERHCFDESVQTFPARVDESSMFNRMDAKSAFGVVWSGHWAETSCSFGGTGLGCRVTAYARGVDQPLAEAQDLRLPASVSDFLQ